MEDLNLLEDDALLPQIDWNDFFDSFPEATDNGLQTEAPPITAGDSSSPPPFSNSSPGSISSWIYEIENALMDDGHEHNGFSLPTDDDCCDFLADILVDGPSEVVDAAIQDSTASDCGNESAKDDEDKVSHAAASAVDAVGNVYSNASRGGDDIINPLKDKADPEIIDDSVGEDGDDPISKKRRRQLRNRDAAVKSRERKKEYVKVLEMKSKFLEGECRRLGRLLQCYFAENQALRFSLQMGGASGASLTEQESAVLLLESLLLGSLLWLVGIVCLFTLPQSTREAVPRVTMVEEGPGSGLLNVGGNNDPRYSYLSLQTRRCRATRTRMKRSMLEATLGPSVCL